MPGATDRILYDKTFADRAPVVRAFGAYREDFIATTDQDHRSIVGIATQHRAVRNGGEVHTPTEIDSFKLYMAVIHFILREADPHRAIRAPSPPHLMQDMTTGGRRDPRQSVLSSHAARR